METKYTKGPWKVWGDDNTLIAPPEKQMVAQCLNDNGYYYGNKAISLEEAQANAHLIAACPEMYGALKSALVILELSCFCEEGKPTDGLSAGYCDAWETKKAVRAAIAKAEGRS